LAFLSAAALADPSHAQVITVGAGALFSKHRPEPVAEVYVTSPPVNNIRAYLTTAWTDNEWEPTFISALDRPIITTGRVFILAGPGLLWLHSNDYRPYPILVGTAVIPLPIWRLNLVAIGSTQPFQSWEWSLVTKVAVLVTFIR
jgi:DNA-binding transcriptional LysR family regulator